jgi:predicted membrane protein
MARVLSSLASDLGIVLIITLVIISVYLIDTITPLGEPVWLLYFIPLILSYWSSRYYAIPLVCIVTLLFLIGGFLVSPQGLAINLAIVNRFTFFLVFICAAIFLWLKRRGQIGERNLD